MEFMLAAAAFLLAISNGANDNFKGFATVWGSAPPNYRTAPFLATGGNGGIVEASMLTGAASPIAGVGAGTLDWAALRNVLLAWRRYCRCRCPSPGLLTAS